MLPVHRKCYALSFCASVMLLAACFGAAPSQAFALGGDYGPDALKMCPGSIGGQTPVHGRWHEWEQVFFYAGDAGAFNPFIEAYSKLPHRKLHVVMHREPKQAASPWRQPDTPADWSLYVSNEWNTGTALLPKVRTNEAGDMEIIEMEPMDEPTPTCVDVWIGGRLKLADLRIPAALPVTAGGDVAQDDEINRFIAGRTATPAAAPYEPPAEAETDVFRLSVELTGGSHLKGEAKNLPELPLHTALGKFSAPFKLIECIDFPVEPGAPATVRFRNGDRLTGVIDPEAWRELKVLTELGDIVVPAVQIRRCSIDAIVRRAKLKVVASSFWESSVPEKAIDGNRDTDWNSGNYAPGWIEFDLSSPAALASIVVYPGQDIPGPTTHEIWTSDEPMGDDRSKATLAHTFRGYTTNQQPLRFDFPKGRVARYVQVRTTQSPTWISWWEVEIRVAAQD